MSILCSESIIVGGDGFSNISTPRQGDLGYDITASSDPFFDPEKRYIEYDTDLQICPLNYDIHAIIAPRSSISNTRLMLANSPAIIDNSFRGKIKLRFRYLPSESDFYITENVGVAININKDYIYKKGDKIAQLFFFKEIGATLTPGQELFPSERGEGAFGSTGR